MLGRGVDLRFHARYLRFESLQSVAGILCQRVKIATQWLAIHCGVGRVPACSPRAGGGVMRYKTWRSRNDTHLHVLCIEGSEAFESLICGYPHSRSLDGRAGGRGRPATAALPPPARRAGLRDHPPTRREARVGKQWRARPDEHRMSSVQVDRPRTYASWLAGQGTPSMRRARVEWIKPAER